MSLSSVLFYSIDWGTQRSPCVHFYFSVHFITTLKILKHILDNTCLKGRVLG